jgi:hypothetical protein
MVSGLYIRRLEFDSQNVVLFSFLKLSNLIPTKCPVVVRFEVVWIELNGLWVVLDGSFKVALLAVSEATVVEKVGFGRLKCYGLCKAFNSFFIISPSVKRDALVIISKRIFWLDWDCCGVVLNGEVKLAKLVIGEPSVKQSFEMGRHDGESLWVELYRKWVVTLFTGCVALCMELFGLLFQLRGGFWLLKELCNILLLLWLPFFVVVPW